MKKLFVYLFLITLILTPFFSVSKIQKVEAVGPTPSMTIATPIPTQSDDGKLFGYKFNIKTTYTPDNTSITVEGLQLQNIVVPARNITVIDHASVYYSGNVLTGGITYTFNFTLNTTPQIKKSVNVTPEGMIVDINKPTITSVSPLEAKIGENITIKGANLGNTSAVFFGIKSADMSTAIKTDNTLTVAVPMGAIDGSITVRNPAGEAVSSQRFKLAVDPQDIDPENNGTGGNEVYELLAPIGNFKFAPDNIGEYFNTIFLIAIGLCGALAVIMIVLGGIQYMGDESIFGKTEAKSKIMAAILGLLIALGSYALLNTINPDLLNGGVRIDQVSAAIEEEVIRMDVQEIKSTGGGNGTTKLCTDITTCKALCTNTNNGKDYTGTPPGVMSPSLAQNFDKIPNVEKNSGCLNCTAASNVILGLKKIKPAIDSLIAQGSIPNRNYSFKVVSVYRPAKDQIRVMCNSIYKNPGGLGEKYAYPALSNHGVGSAVDFYFYFDGKKVNNCKNTRASGEIEKILDKAGFQRLNFEAWHFEYGGGKQTCKYPNCPEPKYCSL